ncbi:MAG: (2Fe-2S)-binding protein [Chloroflexi bacterium]|nr:(2Fe-2S)-binding protein [Chloroflexota bacterium]MDA8189188.1 (2Fe-2S)-binding protein [Dehalococcoidales bacterium]
MKKSVIELEVNGRHMSLEVKPTTRLIDVLRDDLGLTGTKEGCGKGDCGACTVLLDGIAVNSCLVLAVQADKKEVTTVEGLGSPDELHPLQEAFLRNGAVQCGYCTPGVLLSAKTLLDRNPKPTREQIAVAISGNLCRCTGYKQIIDAVADVAQVIGAERAAN